MDRQRDGWTDRRMDGRTDGRTDGQTDGHIHGRTPRYSGARTDEFSTKWPPVSPSKHIPFHRTDHAISAIRQTHAPLKPPSRSSTHDADVPPDPAAAAAAHLVVERHDENAADAYQVSHEVLVLRWARGAAVDAVVQPVAGRQRQAVAGAEARLAVLELVE